jgi:hypothetical protein
MEKLIKVEITLDYDVIVKIALLAHERDITFNKMVNIILREGIKELEREYTKNTKPDRNKASDKDSVRLRKWK